MNFTGKNFPKIVIFLEFSNNYFGVRDKYFHCIILKKVENNKRDSI
jgi:hypothetical protein